MSAMQNETADIKPESYQDRLRTSGNRIEAIAERLTALGNKLYGAIPETTGDNLEDPMASTYAVLLDNLEYAVKRCEMSLTRVEEQL